MENKKVIIYSTPTCIYCRLLKDWLNEKKIVFTDYDLSSDVEKREEAIKKSGQMGVPVIVVDGKEVLVGFDQTTLSHVLGVQ